MNKLLSEVSFIIIILFADISHVCSLGCVVATGNNSTVVVKLTTYNLPKVEKTLCKHWEYYTLLNKSSKLCSSSTVVCTAE